MLEMSDPVSSNTLHNIPLTLMTTMGYVTGLFPVSINNFSSGSRLVCDVYFYK